MFLADGSGVYNRTIQVLTQARFSRSESDQVCAIRRKLSELSLPPPFCISLTGFMAQAGEMRGICGPSRDRQHRRLLHDRSGGRGQVLPGDHRLRRRADPQARADGATAGPGKWTTSWSLKVNVAFICSRPISRTSRSSASKLLVAPSVSGSTRYPFYIIVHKDSPLASFCRAQEARRSRSRIPSPTPANSIHLSA